MKNNYAKQMQTIHKRGVDSGLISMQMVALLACNNVLDDYIVEDKLPQAVKDIEAEMQRIWREECRESPEDAASLLVGHVIEIRKKLGMEELTS